MLMALTLSSQPQTIVPMERPMPRYSVTMLARSFEAAATLILVLFLSL